MKKYDFLIVGSGLFGATFARLASDAGKRCLVIEKRPHLGGNVYCDNIANITVHKYGAHIFHTSDKEIWDFVNSFVPFNRYTNCPIALAPDGNLYNLPFNMNTFYQLWKVHTPAEALTKIEEQRREAMLKMANEGVSVARNLEEQALSLVGHDIYNLLIKEYTEKQWGRSCAELPAFIIRRLPVRFTFDNNYFNDSYQGIPIGGYNRLIELLLDKSEVTLNCDYFENRQYLNDIAEKIVFTGKIDEFFQYCYGHLDYRTVMFETETLNLPNYQGNAVVNYISRNIPYTRIIEHKHFESFGEDIYRNECTVISKEYPTEWKSGMEPFYPVNDEKNQLIYQKYKSLADKEPNVIFGGRLAEYKYYDMAPTIKRAFELWKKF